MKLFLKSLCAAFVLSVIFSVLPFQATCTELQDEVFRLHILANSDSAADQALKLKVRDRVLGYTEALFKQAQSKQEAERLVAANLQSIANVAACELRDSGSDDTVKAEITRMFFTTRRYENYTLPSGMYDALRLTIGKGEGHNWWCVMFPGLCVSSEQSRDAKAKETFTDGEYRVVREEKQEYKFFIVEFFEKIRATFT